MLAFVMIVALTAILFVTTRNQMFDEKIEIVSLEVERESVYIEREFSKIYEVTESLKLTTENIIDNSDISNPRDYLINLSETIVENNPNIVGVNLIFKPNIIDDDTNFIGDSRYQFDGQFITYVSKQSSEANVVYIDNYDDYEMYERAILLKDDFFTEPYYFDVEGTNMLISTVVFPIVKNGLFLGLVGIDFTAEYVFENMKQFDDTYTRRDIIVSQDGLILLNTADDTTFGDHISEIHPLYFTGIATVDLNGKKIGEMENGNIEVLYKIQLGSTGENWYIFSDVEKSLLMTDVNRASYIMISIGLALLAIYLIGLYFINSSITKPITDFTRLLSTFSITEDDIDSFTFETKGLEDLDLLKQKFRDSILEVKENFEENSVRNDLQQKQLNIRNRIQSSTTLSSLSDSILELLCEHTDSIVGALYIYTDKNTLDLVSQIGLKSSIQKSYQLGEGIIGSVGKTCKHSVINHSEAFEPLIDYGISETKPPCLVVYPLLDGRKLIGVIQLVSIKSTEASTLNYLEKVDYILTSGIQRQLTIETTNILFEKTKKLAEELELQQEELRVKNEELESQQEELRITNEELETQQEELRVTNKELSFNIDQINSINKELENTKEQLQIRTIEAEKSNLYKSEFLANMSHELRTPLNSILILSNLILENPESTKKAREYASTINSAGKDLLELINGILDLSKIEAGKEEIQIEDWNINSTMNDIYDRYSILAQDKKIEFSINMPKDKINIKTDGTKVKLILTNLISNAIKFTSKGSVEVNIINNKNEVEFHVVDSGIGIRPENMDIIFKEFKQIETDDKRSYSGTGLGLALCKNYALLLKGRITVQSTFGNGSKFTLIIPKEAFSIGDKNPIKTEKRVQNNSVARPVDEGVISDDRHRATVNDQTVLIIDDDSSVLRSLRDYFNRKNIFVIVAETGENGLFLADYFLPNLILVDIKLPRIGGQEIIKKLQLNLRTSDIPVAIISNMDQPDFKTKLPFFQKPISETDLPNIVSLISKKKSHVNRILLVEDDNTHLNTIVEYIKSRDDIHDISIDTCSTKAETLSKMKENLYTMLIVDLNLSDATDFELVEEIRSHKQYKKIPIVVYTGKMFTSSEEEKLLTLVNDIVIKADRSPERLINNIRLFMASYQKQNVVTDQVIFKDKSVLIVDDDIRNIFALTGLLETYNIKVSFETSGQKALDNLKTNPKPDLILMDIMMPEMDGYETMNHIRNMKQYKEIPIIALTAKTMRGDREKCIDSGATEYLSKPLNKDKLLSVLRVWLQ